MKNNDVEFLTEKVYQTMLVLNQERKTAWTYGIDIPLYHAEVHLLDHIQVHKGANVSELAKIMGMTPGAVWQVARKLRAKGLVESYREPGNKKEVYFRLTDLGKQAYDGHQQHHEKINTGILEFTADLDEKDIGLISDFLDAVIKGLPG